MSAVLQMLSLLRNRLLRTPAPTQFIMGIIVLAQPKFLKFKMESNTSSGVACFITAIIQFVILVLICLYERKDADANVSR